MEKQTETIVEVQPVTTPVEREPEKGLTVTTPAAVPTGREDVAKFELMQRTARILATSTLIPDEYRNNLGNCYIAATMAERLLIDPYMFMTECRPVRGQPCISGKLAIAAINMHGPYPAGLRYEHTNRGTDKWACRAYGKREDGEIVFGPEVSVEMAKKKGWWKNEHWQNSTELMLEYRSAAFHCRTVCPQVLMGLKLREELLEEHGYSVLPKVRMSPLNDKLTEPNAANEKSASSQG